MDVMFWLSGTYASFFLKCILGIFENVRKFQKKIEGNSGSFLLNNNVHGNKNHQEAEEAKPNEHI
jgi:hypothetical protein